MNTIQILSTGLSGLIGSRVKELCPSLEFTDLSLENGHDILDINSLEASFKNFTGNVVLHLAAFTDTNAAWEQKGDKSGMCFQLNVIGTDNLVKMCQKYGKHLIHISTDFVFDGTKDGSYTEVDQPNPLDWYGETKYLAERVVVNSQIPSTILRVAYPYRANFSTKIDLIRKIITKLKNGEICKLFNDQFTTPTFIDDIAAGIEVVCDDPKGGIFHLVGSSFQSVYHMGLLIAKVFQIDPTLVAPSSLADYLATPNARPYARNLSLSNAKFVNTYHLEPFTLEEGLGAMKSQMI